MVGQHAAAAARSTYRLYFTIALLWRTCASCQVSCAVALSKQPWRRFCRVDHLKRGSSAKRVTSMSTIQKCASGKYSRHVFRLPAVSSPTPSSRTLRVDQRRGASSGSYAAP